MSAARTISLLLAVLTFGTAGITASAAEKSPALTASEIGAFRQHIQANWSIPPALLEKGSYRIVARITLDRTGAIVGEPEITASGSDEAAGRAAVSSVRRALLRSAPFKSLPVAKYEAWKDIIVNFDTSDLR